MWINLENIKLSKKRPDTKGYILYDSIYVKCPNRPVYTDRKQINGCQKLEEMRNGE